MSTLKVNTIQDTSGNTQYTAKAWVNFKGTSTVSIRGSGNVSSITDNGTGNYRVNFTNSMPDTNYAPTANCEQTNGGYNRSASVTSTSTTYSDCRTFNTDTNVLFDAAYVYVHVIR